MTNNSKSKAVVQISILILILTEALIVFSSLWDIRSERSFVLEFAKTEALASFNRDAKFRTWAAMHGGVYVPISDFTPPNPYLRVPNREIFANGTTYTLVNPAYMNRQLYELDSSSNSIKGHITSLNPIRPENKADDWETAALMQFENGVSEVTSIEKINNEDYLRLMRPFIADQSCLKCHSEQGYNLGDIRGGISVSVPMSKYYKLSNNSIKRSLVTHSSAFISFFFLFVVWYSVYRKQNRTQELLQNKMNAQNKKLIIQNDALQKATQKAEESNKLKSAFLANMSHEIRTPMNGILGFTNLLKEPNLKGRQRQEYINIIQKSGDRMLTTLNDIMEISKIETGQIKISSHKIDIGTLFETLYDFFSLEAKNKELDLIVDNKLPEEYIIVTDKTKLNSILSNLIKNAIKFTDSGTIKFGCNKEGNFIKFHVKDTGIGIPKNRREAIFNRFEQADIEDKQAREGSGLGLAIVKSYVEMLGGKVWVESEEKSGSTFFFTLPSATAKTS